MKDAHPTIAILYGAIAADAPADEQDVLAEVAAVSASLQRQGWRVQSVPLGLDLNAALAALRTIRPALLFNLVEAVDGRGQLISLGPLLAERGGYAYTGAPLEALFVTSNKVLTKQALTQAGIPTPAWARNSAPAGQGPWIVKSQWEHASIGLDDTSVVADRAALERCMAQRRAQFGGQWFVEHYVEGREFNVAVIETAAGPQVLPIAEIVFEAYPAHKPRIVGYRAKWDVESFEYRHTRRRFVGRQDEREWVDELERVALQCWRLFGLRGYARVDFRIDAAGAVWVLEVNANPCLSPDAGLAAAAAAAGLTYDELVEHIVRAGLGAPRAACAGETGGADGSGDLFDAQAACADVVAPTRSRRVNGSGLLLRDTLRAEDVDAITQLITATRFFHAHEIAVARELLEERLAKGSASGYEFVIAERAGEVLGYTCYGEIPCTQGSYDLYWIVVAAHCQGSGIGRALLEETERRARAAGGRRIYIETSARPLYEPTRAFYRKCGYRQAALLADFYAPGDGKLVYERALL